MGMKLENGRLVIELKLEKPTPSKGKSLVVGSTCGVKKSGVRIGGKPVRFVANAFIKKESRRSSRKDDKKQKAAKRTQ